MVVWRFEDDCFVPERKLRIDFTGPDAFRINRVIREKLERIFQIEAIDLWERDFRFDTTDDPRTFYMRFYANKRFDAWTTYLAEVTIQGRQPVDINKDGSITIYIAAKMMTEYNMTTFLQKSMIYKAFRWIYHHFFYTDIRKTYIKICAQTCEQLWKELREFYGMPVPGGA